ncbi:MAG: VOC family protein [Actinomycetota bacterium]|nr:VOC family protein [Actinomycetota bacterium]
MVTCQHVAFFSLDLEATKSFFQELLGLEVANYDPEHGLLVFGLAEGFVLRFERTTESVGCPGLRFVGLEFSSFDEVDALFEGVSSAAPILADMRERYRDRRGPYGFVIEDPNGYRFKIFKYNGG